MLFGTLTVSANSSAPTNSIAANHLWNASALRCVLMPCDISRQIPLQNSCIGNLLFTSRYCEAGLSSGGQSGLKLKLERLHSFDYSGQNSASVRSYSSSYDASSSWEPR